MSVVYEQRKSEYLKVVTPYLDKNFLLSLEDNACRLERESELIVGYELLSNGYCLQKRTTEKGPDFLVIHEGKKIWIEVVTPNQGAYLRFKTTENLGPGTLTEISVENCKLKIASAIKDKKDKYIGYQQNGLVVSDDVRIICINVYNLDAGMKSCPHCASILYGIDEMWSINPKTYEQRTGFLDHLPILKPSGNNVRVGFFNQQDYGNIDGVLWFDYSLGTIYPDKCIIQLLANNGRKMKVGNLFGQWERIFYEQGKLFSENNI